MWINRKGEVLYAKIALVLALVVMALSCAPLILRAQDANQSSEDKPAPEKATNHGPQAKSVQPYRLDFSFYELEDGKKINTRHYSLDLTAGSTNSLKIGTRVPVATGANTLDRNMNFQYMDVGTSIWANLSIEGGGELRLDARSDVSNLDLNVGHDQNPSRPPIVRQIQINGITLLVTGKPILIGSMDDPNSNRQFQLEVMATSLR
jgi:hypothetical protein